MKEGTFLGGQELLSLPVRFGLTDILPVSLTTAVEGNAGVWWGAAP